MNLSKVLKKRLVNQFISVIVYADSCNIKQKIIKGSAVLHKEEFNYDINSKDDLGTKVTNFINSLQEKYNNTYIALFLNSSSQGLIPSCDKSKLESFHIDQKSVKTICKDGRFLMYSTWIDIKWADKIFAKTGLDFIFSPFLVLDFFISKFMKKESYNPSDVILYLLRTKNGIALMIMRGNKLLYGSFFNTAKEDDLLNIDYDENIEGESLDELDLDSIDEMGMDDILDVADNSHFSSAMVDDTTMLSEEDERIIKYINISLKEFYEDELYESQFITVAKIFDDDGMSDGVLKFLENDLLLDTSAENISVSDAVLELAIKEALGDV